MTENGWGKHETHVLEELKRINKCLEENNKIMLAVQIDISMLKVKAGLWGAVAGLIPSAVAVIWIMVKYVK